MASHWNLVESSNLSAEAIMAKDIDLLSQLNANSPLILHLYEWQAPALTYGYFIQPSDFLYLEEIQKQGIQIARRPTGGGIVFHLTDFAFSILIPTHSPYLSLNSLENYAQINRRVARVIAEFMPDCESPELLKGTEKCACKMLASFCMAKATHYDLMWGEKKIGGAAQRHSKKHGLLHQGSLSLAPISQNLLRAVLKNHHEVIPAIIDQSGYLMSHQKEQDVDKARLRLRHLLKKMMMTFD